MKLILLKSFNFAPEAEMAKNFLDKNGIKAVVQKGGQNASAAYLGDGVGADVYVLEKDWDQAKNLIDEV